VYFNEFVFRASSSEAGKLQIFLEKAVDQYSSPRSLCTYVADRIAQFRGPLEGNASWAALPRVSSHLQTGRLPAIIVRSNEYDTISCVQNYILREPRGKRLAKVLYQSLVIRQSKRRDAPDTQHPV
jgi:hypothetical protein